MQTSTKVSDSEPILRQAGRIVKARIVAAGIKQQDLAATSGFSNAQLTQYVKGTCRNALGQARIVAAFRRLTGKRISSAKFWGDLWAEKDMDRRATA